MDEIISAIFEGIFDLIGVSVKNKKTKIFLYIITIIIMIAVVFGFAVLAEFIVSSFKANPTKAIIIAVSIILSIILLITLICFISKKRKK